MLDGLYTVHITYLTAGFVIKDGKVIRCAPILAKNLEYYKTIAIKIN
jgi:hypothetical protein